MEEKKKRWRPSLTAYREMEETVHRQCVELDAWRDKYRELEKSKVRTVKGSVSQLEYDALLEKYNKELLYHDVLSREMSDLQETVACLKAEVERLESRGFWARVFNR